VGKLSGLKTPALILDQGVLARNCAAMATRMQRHSVRLRPHVKTAKAARVAEIATAGQFGGITVSTLAEARYFAAQGYRDITYAVGMVPAKLDEAAALQRRGVRLGLITDNLEAAEGLAARSEELGCGFPILIEVDSGGERAGVAPDSEELIALGRLVEAAPALTLEGVLTHAGQSYHCRSIAEVEAVAEAERDGITTAASRLRAVGLPCPVVSAGSTPTAVHARSLEGVTEMRPGVYVFFDLDQVGIGACGLADIALSVLARVIGHNRRAGRILIDAGALALSKDVSAGEFMPQAGYGLICPLDSNEPIKGLRVADVHQEHGLIASSVGEPPYERFPPGSLLRILPNHACITAAAHNAYQVVDGGTEVVDRWERVNGW